MLRGQIYSNLCAFIVKDLVLYKDMPRKETKATEIPHNILWLGIIGTYSQ